MTFLSILGLVSLLIGVLVVGWGIKSSQTWTNKIVEGVTGHYKQRTIGYLVAGALLILVGIICFLMGWHAPLIAPS